jgi:hypothetical protein
VDGAGGLYLACFAGGGAMFLTLGTGSGAGRLDVGRTHGVYVDPLWNRSERGLGGLGGKRRSLCRVPVPLPRADDS